MAGWSGLVLTWSLLYCLLDLCSSLQASRWCFMASEDLRYRPAYIENPYDRFDPPRAHVSVQPERALESRSVAWPATRVRQGELAQMAGHVAAHGDVVRVSLVWLRQSRH